jgi:hypothetical protein
VRPDSWRRQTRSAVQTACSTESRDSREIGVEVDALWHIAACPDIPIGSEWFRPDRLLGSN